VDRPHRLALGRRARAPAVLGVLDGAVAREPQLDLAIGARREVEDAAQRAVAGDEHLPARRRILRLVGRQPEHDRRHALRQELDAYRALLLHEHRVAVLGLGLAGPAAGVQRAVAVERDPLGAGLAVDVALALEDDAGARRRLERGRCGGRRGLAAAAEDERGRHGEVRELHGAHDRRTPGRALGRARVTCSTRGGATGSKEHAAQTAGIG
jgi:hypothetical protein